MSYLELIEKLKTYDETLLLELLNVSSEELVDAFLDKIYDRIEYIKNQLED